MDQQISFEAHSHSPDGLPVYTPGDVIKGQVTVLPDKDAHTRGVQLWVGCHIHGSGTAEEVTLVAEHFISEGDLTAGQPAIGSFETVVPELAPLSYKGRRINFDWQVRLRIDVPVWPDKRYSFPFVVEPRRSR
jgi:hypothetical protein